MDFHTHSHQSVLSSILTYGSQLLYIILIFVSSSIHGQVVINEVITDPQQDWSSGSFLNTAPGGTPGTDDEWIELYITTSSLDLTGWQITVDDGTPFSGDLTNTGAFDVVNYIGSGSISNTVAGDYIILGNPDGTGLINNDGLTITLEDDNMPTRNVIDEIVIDGSSGTMFTGNATGIDDESVCRIPNGVDTNIDSDDFVLTRATLGTSNSPSGTVLINEIVTDPQQDWEGGGFTSTPGGGGANDGTDEWIELYIGTAGLNLTRWTISVDDGAVFSGDLTSSGAFQTVNYVGSGSFVNTQAGDYLVLGNPTGSEAMNNDVFIQLFHPDGTLVDDVEIGDDPESDGNGDGAPDGSASGGDATGISDESVARIANGVDTDNDINDFQQSQSTIGSENGLATVYVDAAATDDTGLGTIGDPKQSIQSGVDLALTSGTVTVIAGSYAESITFTKALTLNGANQGIAGNGTRGTESIIDVSGVGITATADNVTVDGFQLGTNASTSDITNGIVVSGSDISITNNIVYSNSLGISAGGSASGVLDVSDNVVSMLAVEDALNATNGSVGIYLNNVSGTADADVTDNDVLNAATGIVAYGLTSSTEAVIGGGNITGCTTGILPSNADGLGGFSPSTVTIQNITMSGFTTDADVGGTETGVYAFVTGSATISDDLTVTMNNLDISGTGNTASNYSGIIIGDFPSATDGISIDATITNCNIHDNRNRGIYTRGADATTIITQCTLTGNGFDPTASGGNPGFSVIAREGSSTTLSNSFITNPAALSGPEDILGNYYTAGLHISTSGTLTVSDCSLDNNGNGFIAETSGIDLSGNYFGTTDEATILAQVGASNDFTPWLSSSVDTDGGTSGFQGDFGGLIVGLSGTQTGSAGRIEEGINLLDAGGTLTVNAGTYSESITIDKSLTMNGANQGIDGNGTRVAESVIEPGSQDNAIEIDADNVTLDGLQIGVANVDAGVYALNNTDLTIQNNVINADSVGIALVTATTGTIDVTSNEINAADFTTGLGNLTTSLILYGMTGDVDVNVSDNEHAGSALGIFVFGCLSSNILTIANDTVTSSIRGASIFSFDGVASRSSSTVNISGFSATSMAEPGGGITNFPEAGIYFYSDGSSTDSHLLTATVSNSTFSDTENSESDVAGIICGDFSSTDYVAYLQDITISECTFSNNENRGIQIRGQNTQVAIDRSTFSNNGYDPVGSGGNFGFHMSVRADAEVTVTHSFFINPASQISSQFDGLTLEAGSSLSITECNFDQNGNGLISGTSGIDLSNNYFGSTDETTISGLVTGCDFSPWISTATDTSPGTAGFQPDLSGLIVGPTSPQTSGTRLQEAQDLVDAGGTITILQSDYNETFTVNKNVSISPAASTTIDDITLNGGNLSILADLEVNNTLTLTNGILDVDLDDGNKSDDPTITLNGAVAGTFSNTSHVEGKMEVAIGAAGTYTFPSGDAGSYRPAILTPTNATTFSVAHIEDATPVGGGSIGDIVDLVGTASSQLTGNIESILNTRYWEIDVISGTPGSTNVTLQITGSDNATDPATLGMTRFDGTNWSEMTRVGAAGSNPFTITGQTSSFSEFSIYSTNFNSNPLPVELIQFDGTKDENLVNLTWSTLTEINANYFQVERMGIRENDFKPIGKIQANGNSNERMNYSFIDQAANEQAYYYRLKMMDFDGSFEYSNTILATSDFKEDQLLLFPTPTKNYLQIKGIDPLLVDRILIFDLSGKLKFTSNEYIDAIDVSDISPGHYAVRLVLKSGYSFEGKLIKE
ncbi:right-handed parallel beta-helix repeat-containing protein [Ekhidna sp.]|uniref:right-handed parallel beta-helix repeat-containing protein n=1 Tax=Ekhidna sp. TaxID=2608089 RepID=UPI003B5000C5